MINNQVQPKNNDSLNKFAVPTNTSAINGINNLISIQNISNKEIKKGAKPLKTVIIIVASIAILIAATIILIVVLTKKNNNNSRNIQIPGTKVENTDLIDTTKTTSMILDDNDNEGISYEEAQALIGLEDIKEIHNLLDKSIVNIDQLIISCNNTNISELNVTINNIFENIDSLINNTEEISKSSKEALKSEFNFIHYKYKSLYEDINSINNETTGILSRFISSQYNKLKDDIKNITNHFEKTIQILAIPYKLNLQENTSNLRFLDDKNSLTDAIASLFKRSKELLFNKLYEKIGNDQSFLSGVIRALDHIHVMVNAGILDENLTATVAETIALDELVSFFKNKIFSLTQNISFYLESIEPIIEDLKKSLNELENSISSFKEKHKEIIADINKEIEELYKQFNVEYDVVTPFSDIILESLLNKLALINGVFEAILNLFKKMKGNDEIVSYISLDLLFIIDISNSLLPYMSEIKEELTGIIDKINGTCEGMTINIGLIGYRHSDEKYFDINFSENQAYIKRIIDHIDENVGGSNFIEDVSLFELALNKNWESKTKTVIFVADSPEHEINQEENKKNWPKLESRIEELAIKNISLFCLKINEETDKIYDFFDYIYDENNSDNKKFQIIDRLTSSFKDEVTNYLIKIYNEELYDNEFCLVPKEKAISTLKFKYGIINNNPDDNLRFILGKCNPVLLVPGVYSTKLIVEFNCEGIAKYERETTLKDIRVYCGYFVCPDENKKSEEHPLMFAFFDDALGIKKSNEIYYGSCLGHIASYYMNDNECPKVNGKKTCYHSDYIKVGYYGSSPETLDQSRCGIEGASNVFQTGHLLVDSFISLIAPVADVYNTIAKKFIKKGYKEGFSLGAIPNDYRRYLSTNNFAANAFRAQINRLYKNTGKPVVVIGHSYGTLLSLTNLLKNKGDNSFMKKIKKFVALAPPYSGATKLLDIFLHGTKDFNNKVESIDVTYYHLFGQYLWYKSLPVIMELKPQAIAAKIFTEPEYSELGAALKDRLEIEKKCENRNCDTEEIKEKTSNFDNIFKGYFPSLLDVECAYESNIGGNDETLNRKCFTNIYNVGNCPTIILKSANPDESKFKNDAFCGKYTKTFYQGECESGKDCLDKVFYSDKSPYVFNDAEPVKFLISRFNLYFSETIDESYFDSHEFIRNGFKQSIEYQNDISMIKDLPVPPIDTDLLYATFFPTMASLAIDDNDFSNQEYDIYKKGGDETVPSWSSLLTGLKWIYDIKKKNLPQKVKLVEYCSRLAASGQYKYNPTKEQNFAAIGCRCLENNNVYKDNEEIKKCSHAEMLQDTNLFRYIYSVANNPKENIEHTYSKKQAAKDYDKNIDYEDVCNNYLYDIFQSNNFSRSYIADNGDIDPIYKISRSICRIEYSIGQEKKLGMGFLVKLLMPEINHTTRGILTTNYVLDPVNIYDSTITVICNQEKKRIDLNPAEHIYFSDSFIDVTFIELNEPEFNKLPFMNYEKKEIKSKDIFIINNLKELLISNGQINNYYGFKLYHDINLDASYSGSAIFSKTNNEIIGIYSNKEVTVSGQKYFTGTNMEQAFKAIQIMINSSLTDKSAFIQKENKYIQKQVKNLTDSELSVLNKKGLKISSYPGIFISSGNFFVTDLWFYRTNHAWYWTPTKPSKGNYDESNWLIICTKCSLKVIGSEWDGEEPANKNINLIHWLASTGFEFLL